MVMNLIPSTQTYADIVNEQFNQTESHYVSLKARLKENLSDNWSKRALEASEDEFRRRYSNLTHWEQMQFCKAQSTTLDKIIIDTTLQRLLDLLHASSILRKFRTIEVMPISVYEDPNSPGNYVCWDGQHTAIVLLVIATRILNLDIKKCEVPINIYPSSMKSEMRLNFIYLNGTDKKPLDAIDLFHQMVFGVRTDGAEIEEWKIAEQKQTALENAKMFATNTKFGDTNKPGALTVLTEFTHRRYDLSITQHFCKYFMYVCNSSRPVSPKESWMMYEYFRICEEAGIVIDDAYIRGVANSLRTAFNDDFDANELYEVATKSWQDWFRINKPNNDNTLLGISYPEKRIGVTFLLEQVRKNFSGPVPVLSNPLWIVPEEDLI
jgi:hypothetical protein